MNFLTAFCKHKSAYFIENKLHVSASPTIVYVIWKAKLYPVRFCFIQIIQINRILFLIIFSAKTDNLNEYWNGKGNINRFFIMKHLLSEQPVLLSVGIYKNYLSKQFSGRQVSHSSTHGGFFPAATIYIQTFSLIPEPSLKLTLHKTSINTF